MDSLFFTFNTAPKISSRYETSQLKWIRESINTPSVPLQLGSYHHMILGTMLKVISMGAY